MAYEFYGSLMVYALAFLLATRPALRARLIVIGGAAVACGAANPALIPFVAGFALAALLPREGLRAPAPVGVAATALALLACGYTQGALGFYAPLTAIWPTWLPIPYLYAAAAALLIAMAEGWAGMRRLLSRPWGRACGELSFPFYLVHVPVLCSVGAYAFLATRSAPAAIAATLRGLAGRRDGAGRLQPLVARQAQCRGRRRDGELPARPPGPDRTDRFAALIGRARAFGRFAVRFAAARRAAATASEAHRRNSSSSSKAGRRRQPIADLHFAAARRIDERPRIDGGESRLRLGVDLQVDVAANRQGEAQAVGIDAVAAEHAANRDGREGREQLFEPFAIHLPLNPRRRAPRARPA